MALKQIGLFGLGWLLCITAQNLQEVVVTALKDVCLQGSACSKKNTEPSAFVQTRTVAGKTNKMENHGDELLQQVPRDEQKYETLGPDTLKTNKGEAFEDGSDDLAEYQKIDIALATQEKYEINQSRAPENGCVAEEKYKINQNRAPWNKCHDENEYEPIFTDLECRQAAEHLALRFNTWSASNTHWPPGCFLFSGPNHPQEVYLPTLNKHRSEWHSYFRGEENHRMICQKKKEKYKINQNCAPWNKCHDENEYEPIFTDSECREAAENLALRFNTWSASNPHWPPGCFFFSGPNHPQQVYLPTLNKHRSEWHSYFNGEENHRMICQKKKACKPAQESQRDAGYVDQYRGWYDVQGCGQCNDYCRWVGWSWSGGPPEKKLIHRGSWWSCRLAGSTETYTPKYWFKTWSLTKCNYQGEKLCLPAQESQRDAGYVDKYRGWYDVQGCGQCNDYCRWVGWSWSGGPPEKKLIHRGSWWSCRLAGSTQTYTPKYWFKTWSLTKCNGPGEKTP